MQKNVKPIWIYLWFTIVIQQFVEHYDKACSNKL